VPLLGCGAALSLIYRDSRKIKGLGIALFGFGLLVFGLDLMKDSVSGLSDVFDLATLKGQPAWVYLLAGMALAAIMQSSSAVMMITLSLLYSDVVTLVDAAALVIGADLGTTSTTVLGSIGSSLVKKQLAFAHVFFNFVVDLAAFILLLPLLPMYLDFLAIEDPMFGLVAFHSTFNLIGVLVFVPALKQYTNWIQRVLTEEPDATAKYFEVPVEVADAALDSLKSALAELNRQAIELHMQELDITPRQLKLDGIELLSEDDGDVSFEARYESLKEFESDLIHYSDRLRHTDINVEQAQQINQIVDSARSVVYASKTLQDIRKDFSELNSAAVNPLARELAQAHHDYLLSFYNYLVPVMLAPHERDYVFERCDVMHDINTTHHQHANNLVTRHLASTDTDLPRVSTWFNLNHELHHYSRYMIAALRAAVD
ncbi:MAG: Na/Pi symporter, partial [Arenicella sp.]|nr:Na/Pi symporter [Arenicella sp.]